MPNVVGKTAAEAAAEMKQAGLNPVLVDSNGQGYYGMNENAAKVVSTDPAAGSKTIAYGTVRIHLNEGSLDSWTGTNATTGPSGSAEADGRYEVTCGYTSEEKFSSYKALWKSSTYQTSDSCHTKINGQYPSDSSSHITLQPQEQAIVNTVKAMGGDVSNPAETYAEVYSICASVPKDYPDHIVGSTGKIAKPEIQGALALCPDAPHAALLKEALTSVKFDEGSYTVGEDIEPGTYSTVPGVRQCYWSRTTGGGGIIANDFIDYAPAGATVSVYAGEGFTSHGCGIWTKTG